MANKRVLELAKELKVEVAEIKKAASRCGVAVNSPTAMLNDDDSRRIKAAMSQSDSATGSGKTLSPRSGAGRSSTSDGRGHTVQVAVRRRRSKPSAAAQASNTSGESTLSLKQATVDTSAPTTVVKEAVKAEAAKKVEVVQKNEVQKKAEVVKAKPSQTPKPPIVKKPMGATKVAVKKTSPAPARSKLSPAQMAAQALEKKKQDAEKLVMEEKTKRLAARSTSGVNQPRPNPNRPAGQQRPNPNRLAAGQQRPNPNRPAGQQRPNPNRPAGQQRPNPNRPAGQQRPNPNRLGQRPNPNRLGQRPNPNRPGGQQGRTTTGPRTTIRKGLTPAQIAAAKAPKSSIKQIEAKITKERNDRRRENAARNNRRPGQAAGAQQRPGQAMGARRTTPNIGVGPTEPVTAPTAVKRRFAGGPGQQRQTQRRLTPAEKAARRSYSSKRHEVLTPQQEERMARLAKGDRRRFMKKNITKDDENFVVREVEITNPIIVSELASRMAIKTIEVVKQLMNMGTIVTSNDNLDSDTAMLVVEEFGHKAKVINEAAVEDILVEETGVDEELLTPRPPVVVVMGHVDHGKTSILDALRKATVAAGEAGGITQHIGAYMVKLTGGERVVFVDTPGHEAFTSLRARGAKLTDVAVLVVAADDGVMPQTVEALNHAKSAGVPIIVAINKMDKDGANPENVKRQLSEHGILPEEWGGDTIFVEVSAHTGQGLDDLLEMLALQTEILELRANPEGVGRGVVVESRLDRGRGPVATVLVQNGTFKKGDIVVVGTVTGRIRAIVDENAVQHRTAGPSVPFELLGLESVPEAGAKIVSVKNDRQARDIISYRKEQARQLKEASTKRASFDDLFAAVKSDMAEVPVIIKGDVSGSVDAMAESLVKLGTDEVKVKIVHKGIGAITESDVMLAQASSAMMIGFNVRPETKAKRLASDHKIDVRFYKVIYDAIDDVRAAMAGELSPDQVEKVTGEAEVRQVITVPKIGAIAGAYVTEGYVMRASKVRVLRDNVLIHDGELASLRRFKDDVKEVKSGYECGIGVEKFNDVKEGDTFEFYIIEEIAATL
ncbi:MAG: translation initiation factor IF-2 [Zetaproteobacteria bacterium]|nr:translation initiation factor IF-2 [Zetaproteobacteria bacterium]